MYKKFRFKAHEKPITPKQPPKQAACRICGKPTKSNICASCDSYIKQMRRKEKK